MEKKLTRSKNKVIAGVCAGFGEYLSVDVTIVRIVWTLGTIFTIGMGGVIVYLIALLLMPEEA